MRLPAANPKYAGAMERGFRTVTLRGKTLQVIVKLANIHLTPERPAYPGGSWHVEGMLNERIVPTGIYYYDLENIIDRYPFACVCAPAYHGQSDYTCMRVLYRLQGNDDLVQEWRSVTTTQGMTLAFPNISRHRVSPFALADPSRPGHRKILAFFLVDPEVRVPSATEVRMQQEVWCREAVDGSLGERLPIELRAMVTKGVEGTMALEEAKAYRAELMKERSAFVKAYDRRVMQQASNMCEH